MIDKLEKYLRRTRRSMSRSEWGTRVLHLAKNEPAPTAPGLVLIQIDGLSNSQFERAKSEGRLPFLARLLKRENYVKHQMYSGVPSSMSAIQAELFYGVEGEVPGLSYYDRDRDSLINLLDSESVKQIETELAAKGDPLLRDGCSYAGIFSGGASESRFSISDKGAMHFSNRPRPDVALFFLLSNLYSLARTLGLGGAEVLISLKDAVRGLIMTPEFRRELKHIPVRLAVCIILRELSVIGAKIDLARGAPILHLNFLGYDEQSHRRGPESGYAHWTLKGIDDAIARVWRAAQRAGQRDYDVWIYSAHGQEKVTSYRRLHGQSVHQAIERMLGKEWNAKFDSPFERFGIRGKRSGLRKIKKSRPLGIQEAEGPIVTAMGSLGHVYLQRAASHDELEILAARMVKELGIPLVAFARDLSHARAITAQGAFNLPEDAIQTFGASHPYAHEVAEDMVRLCHHRLSGDLLICGTSTTGPSITFPSEGGAHGGPGIDETSGFVLAPMDETLTRNKTLRPSDLHAAAKAKLARGEKKVHPIASIGARPQTFRLMTYNVHSCVGMDGKIYPERVARVISQYHPDVVALQEIDVDKIRTGQVNQAQLIAQLLEMKFHFHPSLMYEEEKYGDAILSIHPMKLFKAASLPHLDEPWLEPRGAIMVEVEAHGAAFRIINTHLSLSRRERIMQAEALMGEEWLQFSANGAPAILCGDFNAMPNSPVCRLISQRLKDAQECGNGHKARNTFSGRFPVSRIDHVFVDKRLQVKKVLVPNTHLTRKTSDHLPLIVDITM